MRSPVVFIRFDGKGYETHLATSSDLRSWTRLGCIFRRGEKGQWDQAQSDAWPALVDTRWDGPNSLNSFDGRYWMMYLGMAVSDDMLHWRRVGDGPVIENGDPLKHSISGDPMIRRIGDLRTCSRQRRCIRRTAVEKPCSISRPDPRERRSKRKMSG